jgi:hypothetical protein
MSHISYSGRIQPVVWLSFQSIKVTGAHTSANENFLYAIENESTFEFTINATTPSGNYVLQRRANRSRRLFNVPLNTYITEPVSAATLNSILAAQDSGNLTLTVSIKIRYEEFFLELLRYLTRTDSDTFNLARPADATTVEGSFYYQRSGSRGIIRHKTKQRYFQNIPAKLSGYQVTPSSNTSRPPRIKLYIYLLIREQLSRSDRNETIQIFIASDYSKIYRYGRNNRTSPWFGDPSNYSRVSPNLTLSAPTGIELSLKTWECNVINYLWNHTSLTRGETIRQEIIQSGVAVISNTQLQVIQAIRNKIDERVITANHWGDLREDWHTERYQRKLSDLFGGIHQRRWYASPVGFIRELGDKHLRDDLDSQSALILQYGTGHCGEHATVSFSVIRSLMQAGHNIKFENVIYTGNANIDHAFVVGGIRLYEIINTFYRRNHSPGNVGDPVTVWDLRYTLALNPGKDGFVLDPYLAPSRQAATARQLLNALNASRREAKRTDFLWFGGQFPTTPAPTRVSRSSVRGV